MKICFKTKRNIEEISIDQDENILFAGLKAGLTLPHECASGTCGTCQGQLLTEDSLIDNWKDAPGKKHIPEDTNRILMCQSSCRQDTNIRVFGPLKKQNNDYPRPNYFDANMISSIRENDEVISFKLKLSKDFSFIAGQFIMLQPNTLSGWRAYSICNTKLSSDEIELVLKKTPNGGFSNWLFKYANFKKSLKAFGPLGKASLKPQSGDTDIIAIVGGSGIAGIMAVLEDALKTDHLKVNKAKVFFGLRDKEKSFFLKRLNDLVLKSENSLQVTVGYSETAADHNVRNLFPCISFETGWIHEIALKKISSKSLVQGTTFFIAGPPIMVDKTEQKLKEELNIKPEHIRIDRFG